MSMDYYGFLFLSLAIKYEYRLNVYRQITFVEDTDFKCENNSSNDIGR